MANGTSIPAFAPYSAERARFCFNYRRVTSEQTRPDAIRHSTLISLAVKYAVDNPAPKPSNASSDTATSTSLSGLPTPVLASQQPQPAAQPAAQPSTAPSFSFGKPNPNLPLLSQHGTPAASSNPLDAGKVAYTGGLFSQALAPQYKRQAPSQNGTAQPQGESKVPKLGQTASPSSSRLASDITPNSVATFGRSANGTPNPAFSFSWLRPQTSSSASTKPGTFTPGHLSFDFKPFGAGSYREPSEEPRTFAKPKSSTATAKPVSKDPSLPQYGLLGFDLDNCDTNGNPEPILLNTNSPSSVFLCGSQGSGKSYTLSCMLENHLLNDPSVGVQRETIPGFVFHWDTNTSGSLAEAASLCSRGIKVRLFVSWSNYQQMKKLYENFARKVGGQIEVRPLLFEDTELTVNHIRNLMAFRDPSQEPPLYLEVIQNILRRLGRMNEQFSVKTFLSDLSAASMNPGQLQMLEQRLSILKTFSAATAPDIVRGDFKTHTDQALEKERKKQGLGFKGDCIKIERGTLTIIDLSDPFVDASTACVLFDICLAIILKRHKEAITANKISPGLIVTLDEAHKFLDKKIPSADIFTSSLLTTIREQRHNAARVIIATQEPTISEKLLDLCSISIVHRFSSPAWFTTLRGHLGAASDLAEQKSEEETEISKANLFERIIALQTGESLVFSPTSWVRGGALPGGGDAVEPKRLGSGVMLMKTRERKGEDSGKTWNVV